MHWGDFKDNGCVDLGDGRKARSYSAILWDIPSGANWEEACSKMPADINGVHFDHPTICVKTNIVDALSFAALVVGLKTGVGGAILGAAALIISQAGIGALNMWGVFYVEDGTCGVQTNEPFDGTSDPHHHVH
jgi:hypothetical protein